METYKVEGNTGSLSPTSTQTTGEVGGGSCVKWSGARQGCGSSSERRKHRLCLE